MIRWDMKFLFIFFLTVLLILSCDRSEDSPQWSKELQQREKILKEVAALKAQVAVHRDYALEENRKLKVYRQEIQRLRSETGEGRKERKAVISELKDFANQAKKARKKQRLEVMEYTRKIEALVADFDAF